MWFVKMCCIDYKLWRLIRWILAHTLWFCFRCCFKKTIWTNKCPKCGEMNINTTATKIHFYEAHKWWCCLLCPCYWLGRFGDDELPFTRKPKPRLKIYKTYFSWTKCSWIVLVLLYIFGARKVNGISFRLGDPPTSFTKGNVTIYVHGGSEDFHCYQTGTICKKIEVETNSQIYCYRNDCPSSKLTCPSQYNIMNQHSYGWREGCFIFNKNVLCAEAAYKCESQQELKISNCNPANYTLDITVSCLTGSRFRVGEGVTALPCGNITITGHKQVIGSYELIISQGKLCRSTRDYTEFDSSGCGIGGIMCSYYVQQGGVVMMTCSKGVPWNGCLPHDLMKCPYKILKDVISTTNCATGGGYVDIDFEVTSKQTIVKFTDWDITSCWCIGECTCIVSFKCNGTTMFDNQMVSCNGGVPVKALQDGTKACVTINDTRKCSEISYHPNGGDDTYRHGDDPTGTSWSDRIIQFFKWLWNQAWFTGIIAIMATIIIVVIVYKLIVCIIKKR